MFEWTVVDKMDGMVGDQYCVELQEVRESRTFTKIPSHTKSSVPCVFLCVVVCSPILSWPLATM